MRYTPDPMAALRQFQARVLWPLQEGLCIHCRKLMHAYGEQHPKAASREHFWPQNMGGSDDLENMALAHRSCNEQRGPMPPTDAHYVAQGLLIMKMRAAGLT